MDRVGGKLVMQLQMDKSPGQLDETLVELPVRSRGAQPEVFEDIMGFIVLTAIEANKVAEVAGGLGSGDGWAEAFYERFQTIGFFHVR